LLELEAMTKRKFFLEAKPDMHLDHFVVLGEGKLADLAPAAPVAEDAELLLELVEVDRHDSTAAVGKADGFDVCVAGAASLVGKRVKVRIERVLDGTAYATLARQAKKVPEPLTAEAEAEKPTRKPPARKDAEAAAPAPAEPAEETVVEDDDAAPASPAKKKTRRGSRGGKNRKKTTTTAKPAAGEADNADKKVTIHLPADDLGEKPAADEPAPAEPEAVEAPSENGDEPAPVKKKTRRGSRGGKNRRKRAAAAANGSEPAAEEPSTNGEPEEDWNYVPMSEWGDEFEG
jgi:ribonuclease E